MTQALGGPARIKDKAGLADQTGAVRALRHARVAGGRDPSLSEVQDGRYSGCSNTRWQT
jgi:hypothetical protein